MDDYCVFQQHFDIFLYINDRQKINKENLIKNGGQIPSILCKNFSSSEEIMDHAYLNCLNNFKFDKIDYLFKMDYLQIFKFIEKQFYKFIKRDRFPYLNYYLATRMKNKIFNYVFDFKKFNLNDLNQMLIYVSDKPYEIMDDEKIKLFVNLGANDNRALYSCIRFNKYESIKFLLKNGFILYNNYFTIAFVECNLKTIKLLLKNGANINDNNGEPLKFSLKFLNFEIVKFLIDNGADINYIDGQYLLYSIERLDLDSVKLLVNSGIDVNYENGNPLIECCDLKTLDILKNRNTSTISIDDFKYKMYKIAKFLIQKGADVNAQNGLPLRLAKIQNNQKLIDFLIKNGAQ